MARSDPKRRRSRQMTIPVAAVAGFLPLAGVVMQSMKDGGPSLVGYNVVSNLTGYDIPSHTWNWRYMERGTIPIVAGMLIHKFIGGKLGVNRMLSRAGVPLVRL